jgi:hypothetical protein
MLSGRSGNWRHTCSSATRPRAMPGHVCVQHQPMPMHYQTQPMHRLTKLWRSTGKRGRGCSGSA